MDEDYPDTLIEFEHRFGDDDACREYLCALRWPQGFVCPGCGGVDAWRMSRGLFLCQGCRRQASVTAGTIFQDSHVPLTIWFRAMWQITSQKHGISALGLQRVLGLGSYRTSWAMLHKLRKAMIRPGRERLSGFVEVDEAYWGGEEEGVRGRQTHDKALIIVAAEARGEGLGRIRLQRIPTADRKHLHAFIHESIEPGSTVHTDGLAAYLELSGYTHDRKVQRHQPPGVHLLPRVHRVISLMKRWLLGTHQGAISHAYLDDYLNEFTFRFNRRTSRSRGKLFYRLAQQAVEIAPVPVKSLRKTQHLGGG
jgi:transposase-like protein